MKFGHLLRLDAADAAADFGNQHGKGLEALLHGGSSSNVDKSTSVTYHTTQMLICQQKLFQAWQGEFASKG